MAKKVFLWAFFISLLLQGFRYWQFDMLDINMWANQAKYVETSNPQEFDMLTAYGHPGGPPGAARCAGSGRANAAA